VSGKEDDRLNALDNVFVNSKDIDGEYSMSLFNKQKYYKAVVNERPLQIKNIADHIQEVAEALKAVPENMNEDLVSPPAEKDKSFILPDFKDADGATKISIGVPQQLKFKQNHEVEQIMAVLAKERCPQNIQ
jgi:hypothetical protein